MTNLDLASSQDVLTYLKGTPFESDDAVPLTGGTASYVFRLHLRVAFEGRESLVLKHGKSYIPGINAITFAIERQAFEVYTLRWVKGWLPDMSVVTVPIVHLFDDVANVIIMDDCGRQSQNLKQMMLSNPPPLPLAQQIGESLGGFLALLHSYTSADSEAFAFLGKNHQGKTLSTFATYGRLISTLRGSDALPSVVEPPLDVPPHKLETIERVGRQMTAEIMAAKETLVMGDFWPGNILVSGSPNGSNPDDSSGIEVVDRIFVVDWELTKPGVAGLDIGQFCAEMHLLRRCHQPCVESASAVMEAFQRAYKGARGDPAKLVAREALIHVGAHLVAWTPRVEWGDKEQTRALVMEGVDYLISGADGTDEDVQRSLLGELTI